MHNTEMFTIRPRKNNQTWMKSQLSRSQPPAEPILVNFNNEEASHPDSPSYIPLGFSRSKSTSEKKDTGGTNEEKDKYRELRESLKKYGKEFCSGTSLHGLRYVGAEGVSLFERLFWIVSFVAAVGFSAYFINHVFIKWDLSPVIVGINPKFKTISSIPFPALTICNMNQARKSVAFDILRNDDYVETLLLEDVCKLSNTSLLENSTDEGSSKWETVKNFMIKVSQPCAELVVNCLWQGILYPCGEIINPALTDEGVCCTFNKVASEYMYHHPWQIGDFNITFPPNNIDWTPEEGYPDNVTNDMWPFRPEGAGSHLGLTLVADVKAKEYYCSSTNSVGLKEIQCYFLISATDKSPPGILSNVGRMNREIYKIVSAGCKVRLHSPVESPMVADFGFFLHPRKENRIAIHPSVDEASPTIHDIPIEKRQCLFSYERDLFFYRTYTKNNCEMECISNYTLKECKCVPYYLPKNIDTLICGKRKETCYKKARAEMEITLNPEVVCNCLPACYEISYTADVSIGDISNAKLRKPYALAAELNDLIVIHFFFPLTQFRSYQKSELFGFTEFLANSGGLLGLFLGFSFLSAVEIVYHITLKLWCVYYKKQNLLLGENLVYPFAN